MCELHVHTEGTLSINAYRYDPTHTTTLRNRFASSSNRYFNYLVNAIRSSVSTNNSFGFGTGAGAEQIRAFNLWLDNQLANYINSNWMDKYVEEAYRKGLIRARNELIKAGYQVPRIDDVNALMRLPQHAKNIALLKERLAIELRGITEALKQQLGRVLSSSVITGDTNKVIAQKLISVITGKNAKQLGVTDTLGRFMPARRRAELMARTEVVRAHHLANIAEYRSWGVEGVRIMAEWLTAGDERVCVVCASLEGKIFTLDEIEGMIPQHPQCFIDPQTPIYTSEGWKPIGNVKIGDYVLTHKKRFKKVYALPRTEKQLPEVVKFTFESGRTLTLTSKHPVLKTKFGNRSRWIEADKIKVGDNLISLGNECARCGKVTAYHKKYCSATCRSKDITEKQWANPEHRRIVSEKNSVANKKQYASGERDRFTITKKANEKTKQMVKDGTFGWWMDEAFLEKFKKSAHTPEINKRSSERMKLNNPMSNPKTVEKVQQSLKIVYLANPEKRLNARLVKMRWSGKMTWIEERMANLLDRIGIAYISQYPILNYRVDFAIPTLKIVIECDGEQWHKDKRHDRIRQRKIEKEGWFVLRYTGSKINKCIDEIEGELKRVVKNHTGEYNLLGLKVRSINKWIIKKPRTLYNLSVEDDESYIAKGVVVHNCRCMALPIKVNIK